MSVRSQTTMYVRSQTTMNVIRLLLDSKLQWGPYISKTTTKATSALYAIKLIKIILPKLNYKHMLLQICSQSFLIILKSGICQR